MVLSCELCSFAAVELVQWLSALTLGKAVQPPLSLLLSLPMIETSAAALEVPLGKEMFTSAAPLPGFKRLS